MRLSTSSSDRAAVTRETHEQPIRGAGAPRALLLALVVLVLVELALRAAGPDRVLPYRLGGQEYQAAHDFVHTYGPADVCFVGSSRAREAIHVPTVRDRLEAALDRPVTVANYAVGGARAEETLTIVTKLLDGPHRPRVIFYGIEARQVLVDEQRFIVAARMWAMDEWLANYRAHGRAMFSYLPDAMRNEIGRHYKTFQSRKAVANFVDQQITGWTHTCPLRGEATPYQHNTPDRSLLTDPISEAHTAQYVRNAIALGELIGEGRSAAMLKSIITRCAEAKVTLVLFESPTSPLLDRHTPAGARDRFRAIVGELAERHGITFLIEDDLHVRFAAGDWLEQSHLNVHGARRFTEALIDTTVLPATRAAYGVPADRNTVALHGR